MLADPDTRSAYQMQIVLLSLQGCGMLYILHTSCWLFRVQVRGGIEVQMILA